MDARNIRVCPDHRERQGILNYVCCADECHTLLCDFCLKSHTDHPIFSLSQIRHHRQTSEEAVKRYKGEFREKGEILFKKLSDEINKTLQQNRAAFLKYLDGVTENIIEFQKLYDNFEKYPSLNTSMIRRYMEIKPILTRNVFQYQMDFLHDHINEFLETINTRIANFKWHLEKDLTTNFSHVDIKTFVSVRDAKGYNPHTIALIGGPLVATGSKNGAVCIWDYEKLRECSKKFVESEIFCLEYVKNHQLLFCGCSQSIVVFKVINKALLKAKSLRVNSEVNNILYIGSNILATSEKQYGLILRSASNLSTLRKIRQPEIYSISYIPSKKRLIVDSPRGITHVHVRKRISSYFVESGDLNFSTRSCHGLFYLKNWQKFLLPVNSRKIAQLRSDLSLEKKIDTTTNYGFANKPCDFVANEDESQIIITSGTAGFILIEKENVKFVNLEKIKRSGAVAFIKERRLLLIAEFDEARIYIVKLKSIFD